MFENQPELVRELSKSGKLESRLEAKLQQALNLVARLKDERDFSEDEAFQIAVEAILAPSDGPAMSDNPPEPLSLEEQEEVLRRLTSANF
jgi:hypothetical protein